MDMVRNNTQAEIKTNQTRKSLFLQSSTVQFWETQFPRL